MVSDSNLFKCKHLFHGDEAFLIYGSDGGLHELSLDGKKAAIIRDSSDKQQFTGIDYDSQKEMVFWTEGQLTVTRQAGRIFKASIEKPRLEDRVIQTCTCNVAGVSLDWIYKNIYWTDRTKQTIEVSNLNGKRAILFTGVMSIDIGLDPLNGLMFWTDVENF